MTTKVLIVDDSALVRQLLTEILGQDPQIEVVGTAADPFKARKMIKALNPDVLTLDVEMPKMDGLTFLENLMRLRPMPVLMVSSLTEKGAEVTLQALELGAVDFVTKPKVDLAAGLGEYAQLLREKLKQVSKVKVRALTRARAKIPDVEAKLNADAVIGSAAPRMFKTTDKLVAIGSSTGGTEAVKAVLERMPPDAPAIVIAQHIPPTFSKAFAARMNKASQMSVCEAEDGQQINTGHVYIAPGDRHLMVVRDGARFRCKLHDGPLVNRHKPSVDVLMRSVAQNIGPNACGVILTGMGDDGAQGLLEMRQAGARTIAQDEATSVVWGMPGAAVKMNAVEQVLSLSAIAQHVLQAVKHQGQDAA